MASLGPVAGMGDGAESFEWLQGTSGLGRLHIGWSNSHEPRLIPSLTWALT